LVNSENPRQSAGHESFSGTLAHLYSGAIDLKFPLGRSFKTGRMESQANFLGTLKPTLEKMCRKKSGTDSFVVFMLDNPLF
jgi:hypothetical protein